MKHLLARKGPRLSLAACYLLLSPLVADAARLEADSVRGERLFTSLSCIQCHSVNGNGGKVGPDLSRLADRNFTPATLAATLWNHAPAMWAQMRQRGVAPGELNQQGAADLFAYFYAARLFERAGDAGRGKRVFAEKHCAECHGLTRSPNTEAKAIVEWESATSPIALVTAMWNHAANMRAEYTKRKLAWPELTGQDLADLLVYVRNQPGSRSQGEAQLRINAGDLGERLFSNKGCSGCHAAQVPLTARLKGQTLTDIAVDMWNHSTKMAPDTPRLTPEQMRDLTSYLWADQFFEDSGRASAGKRVFTSKRCVECHGGATDAPKLEGKAQSGASVVAALWRHGPAMEEQMKSRNIRWPRFEGTEMQDLIAYLSSTAAGTK
jgi:mono/diheme cytochrome c family protein